MTFQGDGCPPVGPSRRQRARRKAAAVVVPTSVALGAGAVFAYGAIPASDGTIGACYSSTGAVRFVDGPADCVKDPTGGTETFIKFNQTGPQGPQGAAGAAGPQGAAGPPGAAGAPGGVGSPAPDAAAASDYFLELDGVKGESKDEKHKGEIEILSFSWGVSQTGSFSSGGGGGAGKASFQDIRFEKRIDKSSPLLAKRLWQGTHIKKAVLHVRKSGPGKPEYMTITLENCLVLSFQTKPSEDSDSVPTERVSFSYSKIEYAYSPQKPDGSLDKPIKAGYDLKLNKKA